MINHMNNNNKITIIHLIVLTMDGISRLNALSNQQENLRL